MLRLTFFFGMKNVVTAHIDRIGLHSVLHIHIDYTEATERCPIYRPLPRLRSMLIVVLTYINGLPKKKKCYHFKLL
jgi:hypothetical protein